MSMRAIRNVFSAACVAAVLAFSAPLFVATADAQSRPKDATGQCKDGTYTTAKTKKGACSRHGGVQTWFADEKPAAAAPSSPRQSSAPAPAPTANDAPAA